MKGLLIAWLCCQALAGLSAQESGVSGSMIDPSPGSYPSPVSLALKVPAGASVHYRFLESASSQTLPWTTPLLLEALPGETRVYRLRLTTDLTTGETVTRDYLYRIASPAEPVPTVRPSPGPYTTAISLQADLPAGWSVMQGTSKTVFPLLLDAPTGEKRNFVLEARGPRGQSLTWSYSVDKRDQDKVGLDLISPQPGVWANAQPLVVDFKGMDQVLWSYGDRLDPATAHPYTGPVVLDGLGEKILTVSGHSRLGGWMEKTVRWTNGSGADPEGWPASGVRTSGLDLPVLSGWQESWDEGRSWQPCQVLGEKASVVSRKVLVVQIKKESAAFRYVYWLDARPPQAPEILFVGGWNPQVWFSGSVEALHRVTWKLSNGTSVDEALNLWGPVGAWKVPDHAVAALVTAQGANALSSVSKTAQFSETGWSTPEWEPWDQKGPASGKDLLPLGGRVIPRPGFWPVYEVSDQPSVPEPDIQSPLLEGAFLPTVPSGADRTFYVRFAWRDAGGLIGPASAAFAVRVDRIPPRAPEVVEQGSQIVIKAAEGEEDGTRLLWAVSPDRVTSADALNFQPYNAPLDVSVLRATAGTKPWIHAMVQDRAGNSGPPRLNVALSPASADTGSSVVQVDPDPAVGEIPVSNGGVYPWSQLRLRALDRRSDLWIGAADPQAGVPKDWRVQLKPWAGIFSRSIAGGERRSFLVYWNAKTLSGWVWDQPKTVTLTLDLGPPAIPPLTVPWPKTPLASAWSLTLQPGRLGDVLHYSLTLDGTPPGDPAAGDPWPGTRTWDAQAGARTQVRIRMAAVSVSGLSAEIPLGETVIIDKVPPPPVSPALAPFTYQTALLTVPLPKGSPSVRYTLTSDGSLPDLPGSSSPLVDSGLRLEGVDGKTVLYRFRWRSYSAAGIPGPTSEAFAVLIDRTGAPLASPEPRSGSSGAGSGPRLSGLPPSGISAGPVTLQADWPQGLLRFEVLEGAGSPRSVTAESPLWDKPLVLDGGAGVDRSFSVSVRGFSPDGQPQTPEAHYSVRVDRSVPLAPNFELVLDPRRPEAAFNRPAGQNPDEVMFYRWSWESFPDGKGQTDWAPVAAEPLRFSAPSGTLTMLRVQAFLKDEAGNSGPVADKAVLIDQNVVYVAAQGAGDGSRDHPFGTVAQAVEKMRRDGKSILFVGSGVYPLGKTLDLDGLQVFGGWDPALWEKTANPGRSGWTASVPFAGTSLLESGEHPWSLTRVDLASSDAPLQRLAVVRGARATVRDSSWVVSGMDGGWDQIGGALDGSNITVTYAARPKGSLFVLQSLEAALRGLSVTETLNQDGALLDFQDCQALVQNLSVVSKQAKGLDVVWKAARSRLTVDGARILAGDGAERATAFVFKETSAAFWNSDVALYGTLSNTGFQTEGGRLELQKANLSLLRGEEFNQGLVCDHADVVLRSFQLKVETGSYQGGMTVNGGSLTFASGGVQLAGGGKLAWGAQFQESCSVTFQDVSWVLTAKTPGDLWKIERPWSKGSSVVGSITTGW